jgi:hypothetical protein
VTSLEHVGFTQLEHSRNAARRQVTSRIRRIKPAFEQPRQPRGDDVCHSRHHKQGDARYMQKSRCLERKQPSEQLAVDKNERKYAQPGHQGHPCPVRRSKSCRCGHREAGFESGKNLVSRLAQGKAICNRREPLLRIGLFPPFERIQACELIDHTKARLQRQPNNRYYRSSEIRRLQLLQLDF